MGKRIVEISFELYLSEFDSVNVILKVESGQIKSFTIIQRTMAKDIWHQVTRYDCAHGHAHQHQLYRKDKRKVRLANLRRDDQYKLAMHELMESWLSQKKQWRRTYERG